MKIILQVLIFFLFTTNVNGQTEAKIIGVWNGGLAFGGEYSDSLLLFSFSKDSFHFQYGPNIYEEYSTYDIIGDTLFLIKNIGYQEAAFKIEKLTDNTLILQVLNWPAVYITNTLCSPWTNAEEPKIPFNQGFDTESIVKDEILRQKLEFEILIINGDKE